MFPFQYLLAVAPLTAPPPDAPGPAVSLGLHDNLGATLGDLAVEWEILDPREVRYVLARPEDFASDLKVLRRRYHELGDAPPPSDCRRFPDRAAVSDLLAFNRACRQHLDSR